MRLTESKWKGLHLRWENEEAEQEVMGKDPGVTLDYEQSMCQYRHLAAESPTAI